MQAAFSEVELPGGNGFKAQEEKKERQRERALYLCGPAHLSAAAVLLKARACSLCHG